jgi:hypothetical protein
MKGGRLLLWHGAPSDCRCDVFQLWRVADDILNTQL